MDFIDSPNGTAADGFVIWPNIGQLNGDQEMNLTFRATVTTKAIGQPYLNNMVHAEGITSKKEIKLCDVTWPVFTLVTPQPAPKHESDNVTYDLNATTSMNNSSKERLFIKSISGIEVQQSPNKVDVNSGDRVTYNATILNRGETELKGVTMVVQLDPGMDFLSATPQMPAIKSKGRLQWNLDKLGANGKRNLTYIIEINGLSEDGALLNNNINVSAKDMMGNTVINSSNSMIQFFKVSTLTVANGYAIIKYKAPETAEREPLVRNSTHLGRPLVWDRHAYGGWMEPREGDQYFIFNSSDVSKTNMRVWYTPG